MRAVTIKADDDYGQQPHGRQSTVCVVSLLSSVDVYRHFLLYNSRSRNAYCLVVRRIPPLDKIPRYYQRQTVAIAL